MTSTDTTAADATADTTADTAADTATADDPGTLEQRMAAAVEAAVTELVPLVGTRAACVAVGRSRATHYRHHRVGPVPAPRPRVEPRPQPRALSEVERAEVLAVLHCERFVDAAPATVYATLLDEGRYLCSESTMYRILGERGEVRERRRQATRRGSARSWSRPPRTGAGAGTSPSFVARRSGPTTTSTWSSTSTPGTSRAG
jgi:hypothetical protein